MINDVKRWNEIHSKSSDSGWPSKYAQEKEQLFPRESVVCDLGGGTGNDAIFFLKNGHKVILIDISDYALKVAQDKAKAENLSEKLEVKHMALGLHKIPLTDQSVDVVYSRLTLHYFPASDMVRIFKDIARTLKPEGKAYITVKSDQDRQEMDYLKNTASQYEPGVFIENGQLRARFSIEQLKEILSKTGVQNYSITSYKENLPTGETLLLNEVTLTR